MFKNYIPTVTDRFVRYVQVDTQSDPNSDSVPSTSKQKDLAKMLVDELQSMGITDAEMDELGYVYATLAANTDKPSVPTICFCSHMDTSPDCIGKNVKPIIHPKYQGQDLVLPDDPKVIIKMDNHPDLAHQFGNTIITASGTTLLGADNKAGIAEIMDAMLFLISNPDVKHGQIKILFTPDEEIGRGADNVDLKKLGADFGYTVDGESLGTVENETFSADGMTIEVTGVSAHPGFAKDKMESAIKIASEIIANLPSKAYSPETTHQKEGFVHPVEISGHVENVKISLIIRDFDNESLTKLAQIVIEIVEQTMLKYPNSSVKTSIKNQYRNMKIVLDQYPQVTEYAIEAIKKAGISPRLNSIRGGTDGSRLSFMGLPCPNIFAGEHAFHSKEEWISVQDMEKAVEVIVNICQIWEEKSLS